MLSDSSRINDYLKEKKPTNAMDYKMVFDAGSKALKCAIADENGNLIHIESITPRVIQSEDGFGRKWDEGQYWTDLLELAKNTIKQAAIAPQEIRYISACSIRPSCVFCTENYTPIYIGASFDILGIDYGDEIDDLFSEFSGTTLYERTGHFPSFLMIPARLRWLQNNPTFHPNKKISCFLPLESWILIKFGAEFHTNISSAAETGFFDIHQKMWHDAWYSIFNISEEFFAPPVHSGEIVGNVSTEMQKQMHFSADLELVAGIPDTHASLLAANSVTPGSISAVLGSTTPVQGITANGEHDSEQQSWRSLLAIKNICDTTIIEANTGITGQVIKWAAYFFSNVLPNSSSQEISSYFRHLDREFQLFDQNETTISSDQILETSSFANLGPRPLATTSTDRAPGEFYFPSPGGVDELYIDQKYLIGAVFDNVLFAVTKNIEYITKFMGSEKTSLAILGGISKNRTLCQRFADINQQSINIHASSETSIYGLFTLCDIATGKIKNMQDLQTYFRNQAKITKISPRQEMYEKLRKKYHKWLSIIK